MSRDIKFDLVLQNKNTGYIHHRKYALTELMVGVGKLFDIENYVTVANRQYTGLTDKNGMEIYEGDVIKAVALANDHYQRGATEVLTVREFAGNFCLCFKGHESGVPIFPFNVTSALEIIGNIHENPELINPNPV